MATPVTGIDNEPLLLDQELFKLGCFHNTFSCRQESLESICSLALVPREPTADVVCGEEEMIHPSDYSGAKVLLLHQISPEQWGPLLHNANGLEQVCISHCDLDHEFLYCLSQRELKVLILLNCTLSPEAPLDSLNNLLVLECLAVVGTSIWDAGSHNIASFMGHSRVLSRLLLIETGIEQPEACRIAQSLQHSQSLGYLCIRQPELAASVNGDIKGCLWGGTSSNSPFSSALSKALPHSKLQELDLDNSVLPTPELSQSLAFSTHLKRINFGSCFFTDQAAYFLATALRWNTHLESINLEGAKWSSLGACYMASGLRENQSIVRVNLSRTAWHDQSYDALDLMIGRNKHIQELDLDQLDVSGEDVLASIGSALAHNSDLKRLSFRENDMGEFAVGILSKALIIHASLQHLDLSNCRFAGTTGVLSLAEGLVKNRSLTTISLEACKLGDEGAAFIGRVIQLNRTLQSIDLCENGIQLVGLTTLVNGMDQNSMLQSVYLQGNEVCEEGALLLRSLVREKNKTIRMMFIGYKDADLQTELQYYGHINYAGRRYIGNVKLAWSLWPRILERASQHSDMLMFLVRQRPELFQRNSARNGMKRSLDEIS